MTTQLPLWLQGLFNAGLMNQPQARGLMTAAPSHVRAGLLADALGRYGPPLAGRGPLPGQSGGPDLLFPKGWEGGLFGLGRPVQDWMRERSGAANRAYNENLKRTATPSSANNAYVAALAGDPHKNPMLGLGPADIGGLMGVVKIKPSGMFDVPIQNKAGQEVGNIPGDVNYDSMRVHHGFIDDAAERGKGYGLNAYQELADHALSQGKVLRSDVEVTEDAARMYDALSKRGYKVEKNPNAKLENVGGAMKWVAPSRSWGVFRVVAGPGAL